MLIILISFLAGVLSVLAPCVLPVIPVLFGGGLAGSSNAKTIRILLSAMLFIFLFTFLLKVTTAFISIPPSTRTSISGGIIILYGLTLVFPQMRENIQIKLPRIAPAKSEGKRGDYLLGASLGPIFASCSPTYALLLGTILPASTLMGTLGLLAYMLGFGGFLYILVTGGRSLIRKFYGAADAHGPFKKILGIILLITGVLILSGYMKKIEAFFVSFVPDLSSIETSLITTITPPEVAPIEAIKNTLPAPIGQFTTGYQDFDPQYIPQTGDVVLFFHADRCPTCQEAEKNILANGVPAGLTILKVDFDTATELKQKYSVLSQSSFVYIKHDGTLIKRWIGGRTIADIQAKISEAKSGTTQDVAVPKTPSGVLATAYFAGGCFWCMEGAFEAMDGVSEVINGYAGGTKETAQYDTVSSGKTKHRESVKVVYDPGLVSYEELLQTYRTQIDPTDAGGQFADRGFQYTPAILYQNSTEQAAAEKSKMALQASHTFDKDIAVLIIPFASFYPAEDYHQDYYKKNSAHYTSYKKGSGREDFIHTNESAVAGVLQINQPTTPKPAPDLSKLTDEQRHILFEGGTEPPFDNAYRDNHEAGIYVDVIDGTPLFSSIDKFDSGTGRPSFTRPIDEALVASRGDSTLGMDRTEIISASSSGHLGHVFDDGPADQGGKRFCINSAALRFVPLADMEKEGYTKYLILFK